MKILLVTDTHGKVPKLNDKIDLILHCGDFTIFENKIRFILKQWNALGIPMLLINGNHESKKTTKRFLLGLENIKFIDNNVINFKNKIIGGIGGGGFSQNIPTTKKLEKEIQTYGKIDILITHAPPYHTKLDKLGKDYVGNMNFRTFIEKYNPELCACGHIHENSGKKDKIQNTIIINPGNKGIIIDI